MNPNDSAVLRELLTGPRVLALSVLLEGEPYVSLVPFVMKPDLRSALIHASGLARHTRGLGEGSPFSVLLHSADSDGADPLQLSRVTFQGKVRPHVRNSDEYEEARQMFVDRIPQSEPLFGLGDFNIYELPFTNGRMFVGFARTVNISPVTLAELADMKPAE